MDSVTPNEAQVLQALQDAMEAGTVPDDGYWTTTELVELSGLCRARVVSLVTGLLVSGAWEKKNLQRVSVMNDRNLRVWAYKPKEPA